jgi:transcriptional regulator with XRE-family HTH domain
MKGYGKERHLSHKNSIGRKQTNSEVVADQLDKDPATVSKWCTNYSQPSLETLVQVADALDVDVRSLIVQTKKSQIEIEAEKLLNISPNQ